MNPMLFSPRPLDTANEEDFQTLLAKYRWFQEQGVKWFYIAIDDLHLQSHLEIDAVGQSLFTNRLYAALKENDPKCHMIFCPTWYRGKDVDVPHKKGILERRGRACAMNMIPTSTGAAKAIGKVIPNLEGKILGSAIRVPVSDGSLVDLVVELKKKVTKEEVNKVFKNNTNETLEYTEDPIVSSDIISSTCGATIDGNLTNVIEVNNSQLIHIIAWYDNEMGYSYQMVRTLSKM